MVQLQGGPTSPSAPSRRLMAISLSGRLDSQVQEDEAPASERRGRVDASIYQPDRALLLIEVKIGSAFDHEQLRPHARDWDVDAEPIVVSWGEIHRWIGEWDERLGSSRENPVSWLLASQLHDYLALIDLDEFAGFREDDFEFFVKPTDSSQTRIRRKLTGLLEQVVLRLSDEERHALGTIHVGRFGMTEFPWACGSWRQTGPGYAPGTPGAGGTPGRMRLSSRA